MLQKAWIELLCCFNGFTYSSCQNQLLYSWRREQKCQDASCCVSSHIRQAIKLDLPTDKLFRCIFPPRCENIKEGCVSAALKKKNKINCDKFSHPQSIYQLNLWTPVVHRQLMTDVFSAVAPPMAVLPHGSQLTIAHLFLYGMKRYDFQYAFN